MRLVSKVGGRALMPRLAFCKPLMSRLLLQAVVALGAGLAAHGVVVVESVFQAAEPAEPAGPEVVALASRAAAVVPGGTEAPVATAWVIPLTRRALPRSRKIPEATPCGLRKPLLCRTP